MRKKSLLLLAVLSLALLSGMVVVKIATSHFSQQEFRLPVALVMLDNNETTKNLMNFAMNTPEISQNYHIISANTQAEGIALVEENQVYGCIVLPENFLYSLQNGLNYPPLVILNSTQTADAQVLSALFDVVTQLMRHSQSGIYSATDFVLADNSYDDSFYFESNMTYLTQILGRENCFQTTLLPYTTTLNLATHYGLTLAIFLLFLSSAIFYDMMNIRQDYAAMKLLSTQSGHHQTFYFTQLFELFLLYFLLFLSIVFGLGGDFSPLVILSVANAAALLVLSQGLFFQLIPHPLPAMALNLTIHTFALIAAGGVLPTLFLPQWLSAMATFSPLTHIRTLLSSALVTMPRLALFNLVVLSANWLLGALLCNWNDKILAERGTSYDLR